MLSSDCNSTFVYTHFKKIIDVSSGKCVRISDQYYGVNNRFNNRFLEVSDLCQDDKSDWIWLSDNLKNPPTGKCIHPFRGGIDVLEGNNMVLHVGCNEDRLAFQFNPVN